MAAYIGSKSFGTVKRLRQFAETIKKFINRSREELLNPRTESVVMLLLSSSIFYWEMSVVFFLFYNYNCTYVAFAKGHFSLRSVETLQHAPFKN